MKLSLSEISTVAASFEEDVAAYAAAGFEGIGIWEFKLPDDDEANRALLRAAGSASRAASPPCRRSSRSGSRAWRDLPIPTRASAALCSSVRRLATYEPECVLCLTGPAVELDENDARRAVIDGLREVATAAREAGVRIGLEPAHASQRSTVSFVNSIAAAIALLDEAGLEDVGIMADTYNLWEEAPGDLAKIAARVTGLHVADVPRESRRTDRLLPGEGGARSAELVQALVDGGWNGFLDIEIFSSPDRFWGLPVDEAARRAYAAGLALLESL